MYQLHKLMGFRKNGQVFPYMSMVDFYSFSLREVAFLDFNLIFLTPTCYRFPLNPLKPKLEWFLQHLLNLSHISTVSTLKSTIFQTADLYSRTGFLCGLKRSHTLVVFQEIKYIHEDGVFSNQKMNVLNVSILVAKCLINSKV